MDSSKKRVEIGVPNQVKARLLPQHGKAHVQTVREAPEPSGKNVLFVAV
jgi:hypothetical protein